MPTQPLDLLLNRDMSRTVPKPVIDIASPVLQEAVNYATNAYQRCQESKNGALDEAFPVLASYLHVIQMTDSIEVLISSGCGAPAYLLLRSSFEARLSIDYIIERKSKNRAYAWLVKNIVDQIDQLEAMVPTTAKGKEFQEAHTKDGLDWLGPPSSSSDVPKAIESLKAGLKKPEYAQAYAEYQKLAKTKKYPDWYSLYEGPASLKGLAKHLNQGVMYLKLYSSWSRMSHVSSADHLTLQFPDGISVLGPIRDARHVVHTATMALSILLEATQAVLKEYRSGEMTSFTRWWDNEIRPRHEALIGTEIAELAYLDRMMRRTEQAGEKHKDEHT